MGVIDCHLSFQDPGGFETEWKTEHDNSEVAKKSESHQGCKETVMVTLRQANVNVFDVNSKQRQTRAFLQTKQNIPTEDAVNSQLHRGQGELMGHTRRMAHLTWNRDMHGPWQVTCVSCNIWGKTRATLHSNQEGMLDVSRGQQTLEREKVEQAAKKWMQKTLFPHTHGYSTAQSKAQTYQLQTGKDQPTRTGVKPREMPFTWCSDLNENGRVGLWFECLVPQLAEVFGKD